MPVIADRERAQFRLTGSDFEPGGLLWDLATPAQRRGYWSQVAVLARDAKYAELNRGVDVTGERMPGRLHPRSDSATGRVLVPHWSDSRFETQLRWAGGDDGAVLWWKSPWARIVIYHAEGIPTKSGLVVRDVIGLSPKSVDRVQERARKWWAGQVSSGRLGEGRLETTLAPAIAAAQKAGTFSGWHRVPPPRVPGSIFRASMPAKVPVQVVAPVFPEPIPPWAALQRIYNLWQAAGRRRTSRTEIEMTVRRLGRTQTLLTLRGILIRWGIVEVVTTKPQALRLILRVLLDRLMSGRD